jgi:hypothetical protein
MGDTASLDLADAVTALRGQLIEAQARAEGSAIQLTVEEVTIELALELRRSAKAEGALRFAVISAGGGGERSRTATHRVSLRLKGRMLEGGPVDISDEEDG